MHLISGNIVFNSCRISAAESYRVSPESEKVVYADVCKNCSPYSQGIVEPLLKNNVRAGTLLARTMVRF